MRQLAFVLFRGFLKCNFQFRPSSQANQIDTYDLRKDYGLSIQQTRLSYIHQLGSVVLPHLGEVAALKGK